MNRKTAIKSTLTLLLCTLGLQAQTSVFKINSVNATTIDQSIIECIYKYTTATPIDSANLLMQGESPVKMIVKNGRIIEEYTTILQSNASVSKFWDYRLFVRDSSIYAATKKLSSDAIKELDREYNLKVRYQFVPKIFKNYPQNNITVIDELVPNDCIYEEAKRQLDWILSEDTLTINGYLCNKASVDLGGREWTIWYAPEITISDGPWKLYGLPGLILKASDNSGIHTFEAIALRQSDRPIYIEKNSLIIKMKKDQFMVRKKRLESADKPSEYIPIEQISSISTQGRESDILFINGKRTKSIRISKYEPLEFAIGDQ